VTAKMSQESPQIDPSENIENISEYKTPDSPRKEIAESTQDLAEQILSATHSGQSANLSSPVTSSPLKESEDDVFDNFVQSPSVRDRVKSFEKRFINRADRSRVQTCQRLHQVMYIKLSTRRMSSSNKVRRLKP
jgi:hypothetical protein